MDLRAVIALIRRRQAKFRERSKSRAGVEMNDEMRVDLRIAEEYDSLLAEIETIDVRGAGTNSHCGPLNIADEQTNEVAESQILGDQGQSGG